MSDGVKGLYAVTCAGLEMAEQFPAVGGVGDVDVASDGLTLYATVTKSNQVMVYETSGHPLGRIAVGGEPQALVLVNKGHGALVANRGSRDVSVLDLAKRQELRRIPTTEAPFDLACSVVERKFWVSLHDVNSVAEFDSATGKEVARIPVGLHPYHLFRDPGGVYLYVTIYDENCIAVVDMRSAQVVARVRTGEGPYAVHASHAGRVFVANLEAGTISVFEREKWDAVREIRVGARPTSLALSPDEKQLFVTLENDTHLVVLASDGENLGDGGAVRSSSSPVVGATAVALPRVPSPMGSSEPVGGGRGSGTPSPSASALPSSSPPIVEEGRTTSVALPFPASCVFGVGK